MGELYTHNQVRPPSHHQRNLRFLAPWRWHSNSIVSSWCRYLNLADDDDKPGAHILQTTLNMSKLSRKRRDPTVSGVEIGPSSCTRSNYHQIYRLMDFRSEEATARRWEKDTSRHRGRDYCLGPSQNVFAQHRCAHRPPL